jgi:murein DD-endopeptidase MepM/ murein hydrolase activator NlpD
MVPGSGGARTSGVTVTPLVLDLPGEGLWQARNSPTRRVPSHGTSRFGTAYAIDLVPVDERNRSAPTTWRTAFATEPSAAFVGFGRPLVAPISGTVIVTHDGEVDHDAKRSPVAYLGFALGQARRIRGGIAAVAGNHVVIEVEPGGPYVLIAHLQHGSRCVSAGQRVEVGDPIGACGNSGNSTQPHVHLQAVHSLDWDDTQAVPIVFRSYRSRTTGTLSHDALPGEAETISRA